MDSNSYEIRSSANNVDIMDTGILSEAKLVDTERLAENMARLKDLENAIPRFKARL